MIFNSYQYLIFFPIVLILYYIVPKKVRWIMLLITSYFFYMCWNVKYVILLVYVTAVTYIGALIVSKTNNKKKKIALSITLIAGFLTLFIFKYTNFIIDSINSAFSIVLKTGFTQINQVDIILPMGISFYTFQAIGYLIDVYRGQTEVMKNPFRYALFISFFPQLVAGPIERSRNLSKQIIEEHSLDFDNLRDGLVLMLWGFFQKLVIADRAAIFVDRIYNNYTEYSGGYFIIASVLFAIQIYCDFSGYTYIAMGSARMLGFRLMENFDSPYLSTSVSDFWRRWHISLTSWFKDYLYIPLGGSRKGIVRKNVNKMIVFLTSGLWHGADWSFVVWGGLNGLFQVIEETGAGILSKIGIKKEKKDTNLIIKFIRIIITFILVDFAWIFFRADNIEIALIIIRDMFLNGGNIVDIIACKDVFSQGITEKGFIALALAMIILLIADILKRNKIIIRDVIYKKNIVLRYAFYTIAYCVIVIFGVYGSEVPSTFIYFQF